MVREQQIFRFRFRFPEKKKHGFVINLACCDQKKSLRKKEIVFPQDYSYIFLDFNDGSVSHNQIIYYI